jgi:hypothetical protein
MSAAVAAGSGRSFTAGSRCLALSFREIEESLGFVSGTSRFAMADASF